MEFVKGGVCAPKGFKAAGVHCGIRKSKNKKDLALIVCDKPCAAAAVYTQNIVKGAPLLVTRRHLANGVAQAIICNSGNANTCVAGGEQTAEKMAECVENYTGIKADDVIVASTGVIGLKLDVTPIEAAMSGLSEGLGDFSSDAAEAIMTTDTVLKEVALRFEINGRKCFIGGIAKGSGMIHPNMATMLVFLTTDVNVSSELLHAAILEDVKSSFNMVSVDGDTSTNDMLTVLASGMAGNALICEKGEAFDVFCQALAKITRKLCKMIAKDGEGATKLLECTVSGAKDYDTAAKSAKSVITSNLFKAAMFGADANWGRVLCALGYCGADFDANKTDVAFSSKKGCVEVCKNGEGVDFDEDTAKKILSEDEIKIEVNFNSGDFSATAWGCDLTYDYVKINGDYRT